MYRKILVPVEGKGASSAVLDHAADLARHLGAELVTLRVISVVPSEDYFFKQIQVEVGSAAHKAKATAEAHLAEVEANLRAQGIAASGHVVVSDQAEAEAIVTHAQENGCDLIVVPNQTHAGIGRWLFSSLGDKVRRRAGVSKVPVLFV
jgi:nucleotide-binding universal stress UspA family protein